MKIYKITEASKYKGGEKEMSYLLNQKCYICKKQGKCLDGNVLQAAVLIIHSLRDKGHLGGGTITHDCTYGFETTMPTVDETAAGQPAK